MELIAALIVGSLAIVWWFSIPLTFLQRDPLAFIGVGAAVAALLFWTMPYCGHLLGIWFYCSAPFTPERVPAASSFLGLAVILLLLRRR